MTDTSIGDLLREAVPDGGSKLLPEQVLRSARRRQARRRLAGAGLTLTVTAIAIPIALHMEPEATPARLAETPTATPAPDQSEKATEVFPPTEGDGYLGTVLLPPAAANSLDNLDAEDRVADLLATTTVGGRSLYLVGVVRGGLACTVQFADDPAFVVGPGLCEPANRTIAPGDLYTSTGPDWTSHDPERTIVNGTAPAGTRYVRIDSAGGSVELPVGSAGPRWQDQVFFIAPVPGAVTEVTALSADQKELTSAR